MKDTKKVASVMIKKTEMYEVQGFGNEMEMIFFWPCVSAQVRAIVGLYRSRQWSLAESQESCLNYRTPEILKSWVEMHGRGPLSRVVLPPAILVS